MPDSLRLACASWADKRATVEALERLGERENGALGQWGDDQGGGRTQVLIVIEEVVGQLLDVARAELVVSGHGCLGARQHRWLFC